MSKKVEDLLNRLDEERQKFTRADEEVIRKLVDELVALGVYPTTPCMKKYGYSAKQMVEGWGARWHTWQGPLSCPECKADWRDQENGPPFKREIGIEEHDRCVAFQCPDCGHHIGRK